MGWSKKAGGSLLDKHISFQKESQPYATFYDQLYKDELKEISKEDDFAHLGLSGEAEDRKTSISKAAAPSGAHSKAYCDSGDGAWQGVISWTSCLHCYTYPPGGTS